MTEFGGVLLVPVGLGIVAGGLLGRRWLLPSLIAGVLPSFLNATNLSFAIDWGPIHFQTAQWLSDPGFIDLGFTQLRLVNLSPVIPAVWAFAGFGVITFSAGLPAWRPSNSRHRGRRRQLAPARPLHHPPFAARVDGDRLVVSVIFALRTFDIVWVMTKGGPGTDSEVVAIRLWKLAFEFLEQPQAGAGVAIAVLMSAVLILGAFPYLRRLLREGPT